MSKYSTALMRGTKIHISAAKRGDNEYICCFCGNPMVAKKGSVKEHHFAHKADCSCDTWYGNKGPWHIQMQDLFPQEQQEIIKEVSGIKHIADICIPKSDGTNLIVEFQDSPLSNEDFIDRTRFWKENGDDIIWVFNITQKDIRQIPDYPEYYKWYRPFTTLGEHHLSSTPIVFYMQPMIDTKWEMTSYGHYAGRDTYHYSINGRKCHNPFYLIDMLTSSYPGCKQLDRHDGFHLLYSNDIRRSDESFLSFVKSRLSVIGTTPLFEYNPKGRIWIRFDDKDDYNKKEYLLSQAREHSGKSADIRSNFWKVDVVVYLQKDKMAKTFYPYFYEFEDFRTRRELIAIFGQDNVKIV